jgi:hypothetical protein
MSISETLKNGFLSPVERFSEILFGLIMTLSFTGTMSVISGGRQEVTTTLISVLGCNIAWGIIDAILYLISAASDRGRMLSLIDLVRRSGEPEKGRKAIQETLAPVVFNALLPGELEAIRQRVLNSPEQPHRRLLGKEDILGAAGVFIMVVLSCIPVIFPFLIIHEPLTALRISNGIAILMLFCGGYFVALYAGTPKILTGFIMVALGVAMVGLTIALGG